jgi:charged multivesicular body protein 4
MKNIHGSLDINKVDNTMDDIREQMDLANEISEAISQPVNFGIEFDEDELNEELELLEQQELDELLLEKDKVDINLAPSVPSTAMPGILKDFLTNIAIAQPPRASKSKALTDEDAELEELRQSMAI